MSADGEHVYLKIPVADWRQIESDIEDMAGGEAEILENVQELHFDSFGRFCTCGGDIIHG